jgi:hypothetical protein
MDDSYTPRGSDGAARGGGRRRGPEPGRGNAEAHLLALHVAARLQCTRGLVCGEMYQLGVGLLPEGDRCRRGAHEDHGHRREHRPALVGAAAELCTASPSIRG